MSDVMSRGRAMELAADLCGHVVDADGLALVVPNFMATEGWVRVPLSRSFWCQSTPPTTPEGWESAICEMIESGDID